MTNPDTQQLPHAQESEKYVLGVCMNAPEAIGDVAASGITDKDFYAPFHADVWRAILDCDGRGVRADAIAVQATLEQHHADVPDAAPRLFEMMQVGAVAVSASYHAERVLTASRRRAVLLTGARLQQYAADPAAPIEDTVDRAVSELEGVEIPGSRGPEKVADLILPTREFYRQEQDNLVWSGFPNLDTVTGGFRPGNMVIVAARPGIGKSTLALDIARNVARDSPVMFFTLEMSRTEITARAICAELAVGYGRFTHNNLHHDEMARLVSQADKISSLGLLVDDSPGLTITELQAKARKQHRSKEGLGMVVVDYIGLLHGTGRFESRQVEISSYSRALKRLAGELGVPVIVVAQVSRSATDSGGPRLHHLRESGALEQDADKVLLIHREPDSDEATVTIAKNRAGEVGQVLLQPDLARCRFLPDPSDMPIGAY